MRLIRMEIRPVRGVLAAALGVLSVSVLATLAGPLIVQHFVDSATRGAVVSVLLAIALTYLAVAVIGGATRIGAGYLAIRGCIYLFRWCSFLSLFSIYVSYSTRLSL